MTPEESVLKESWNPVVVLLSIAVAYFGSYCSITLYEQFRLCSKENKPKLLHPYALLVLMAISLGGVAIWSMHFVGMSALTMKNYLGQTLPVYYRVDLSVISLIVVCFFCLLSLAICSRDKIFTTDNADMVDNFVREARHMTISEIRQIPHKYALLAGALFRNLIPLVIGGVLSGTGVCVMHYIGMMAMTFDGTIVWNKGVVAVSVVIAVVAATAAYWILFRLLALFPHVEALRVLCAIIMAVAVNGMHYTGMAAAKFVYSPGHLQSLPSTVELTPQNLAVMSALAATAMFLQLATNVCIADMKVWLYNLSNIVKEADGLMKQCSGEGGEAGEFLVAYSELRQHEGDMASIQKFRTGGKQRYLQYRASSSSNSLHSSSQGHSQGQTQGQGQQGGGLGVPSEDSSSARDTGAPAIAIVPALVNGRSFVLDFLTVHTQAQVSPEHPTAATAAGSPHSRLEQLVAAEP